MESDPEKERIFKFQRLALAIFLGGSSHSCLLAPAGRAWRVGCRDRDGFCVEKVLKIRASQRFGSEVFVGVLCCAVQVVCS